jgi:hypothetical protein
MQNKILAKAENLKLPTGKIIRSDADFLCPKGTTSQGFSVGVFFWGALDHNTKIAMAIGGFFMILFIVGILYDIFKKGDNMNCNRGTCKVAIESGKLRQKDLPSLCHFCRVRNKATCPNKKLFKE